MKNISQDVEVFGFSPSFAQERLWLLDQMDPGNPAYNIAGAIRLRGKLDSQGLHESLNEVVRRHEALRTTFQSIDGQLTQIIALEFDLPLPITLVEKSFGETRGEDVFLSHISHYADSFTQHRFDLRWGPLFRAELLQFSTEDHVLFLAFHHVIADGWSLAILIREVMTLYNAFVSGGASSLEDLEIQYADYAEWQRRSLTDQALSKDVAYWRKKLTDLPVLELPSDYARPPVQTYAGANTSKVISRSLSDKAAALCRKEEITLFMMMLALFQLLVYRLMGNPDVVVGSPVAGRSHPKVESLIGCFLNTIVLRTDLSGNPTFRQLLQRVREVTLNAYSHQAIPFERLLEELKPERDLGRTPLFQIFFNMLNFRSLAPNLQGLHVERVDLPEKNSKFDLTLYAQEIDGHIRIDAAYRTELFTNSRISEMLDQLEYLMDQALRDPEQDIDAYSLVTPGARHLLPDPEARLDDMWIGSVHELFRSHVQNTPTCIAVSDQHVDMTYSELDRISDVLANSLLGKGIRQGDVVAIYAHRSASLVVCLLGILKAGAAFLVLDPSYPATRLIEYCVIARPSGLLHMEAAGSLPVPLNQFLQHSSCRSCILRIPDRPLDLPTTSEADAQGVTVPGIGPSHLAYISFTSGSSGKPKAVMGCHGSLTHFIPWMTEEFGFNSNDRFSLLSALSHDPLHRDTLTPLMTGGRVCIPEPDALTIPGKAAEWMWKSGVTITNLTPAIGQLLLEGTQNTSLLVESLRLTFFVGDILTRDDVGAFHRMAPNAAFINLYGSTETQRAVSFLKIPESVFDEMPTGERAKQILPLGRGMKDVQLLVLNHERQLAGIGETGEIYMRSPHIALGYLDERDLTEKVFLESWFTHYPGDRLYRTGDIGRYLPDGTVESLGRADLQIKIRGFRIELGEIEAALKQHALVRHSVVIAPTDETRNRKILAYVVLERETLGWRAKLLTHLKKTLPSHMIPFSLVALNALPLTPNGKLDRKALPLPEQNGADGTVFFETPRTDLERELCRIMKQVLDVAEISIHDNFFSLGGHSLLAIKFLSILQQSLHVKVTFQQFIQCATVAELSVAVVQAQALEASEGRAIALLDDLESLADPAY
jgi:amino acid adenylation domain-containing protein